MFIESKNFFYISVVKFRIIMKRIISKHQQNVLRKLEMPDNTFKITLVQKFSRIKEYHLLAPTILFCGSEN